MIDLKYFWSKALLKNSTAKTKSSKMFLFLQNISGYFVFICNHLRGSDCRVYFADVKVRLEKRNHFYYPDILVTCDDRDRETATYKRFPKLIVEVLSDSTEAFDRGDKFNDYQTLESLEEYVLVNSKHQRVETFRRGEQGLWILPIYLHLGSKYVYT